MALANIEHRSQTPIWQSTASIYKGTLIAGVYLEELTKKCKGASVYLLDSQKAIFEGIDTESEQVLWEARLT